MLTTPEVDAIRGSWLTIATDRAHFTGIFYGTLFREAPETRSMFSESPGDQGRKLMETLAIVVDGLDNMEPLVAKVQQLGRRHMIYGATPEHYALVGEILVQTLREASGGELDPAAEAAWRKVYDRLAGIMISPDEASGGEEGEAAA